MHAESDIIWTPETRQIVAIHYVYGAVAEGVGTLVDYEVIGTSDDLAGVDEAIASPETSGPMKRTSGWDHNRDSGPGGDFYRAHAVTTARSTN